MSAGPALDEEPAPSGRWRGLRLVAVVVAVVVAAGAGAGWGLQQEQGRPPVVSVQKAVSEQPSRGIFAADLPGTSCGALVDWTLLSTISSGVDRALPCADGGQLRASITLDEDRQQLRIRLVAHEAALDAAAPPPPR